MEYWVTDGEHEMLIEAESAEVAASEYVMAGFRRDDDDVQWATQWVRVYTRIYEECETHTVAVHPEEPECEESMDGHEWQTPIELVGGCEENPGVHGHGGGVEHHEVCARCGMYRTEDTWAQDPQTGEQGLYSIEYADADKASLEWIAREED